MMEIRIDIKSVSEALAHGSDVDQAEIINQFARLLKMACRGDEPAISRQLCYLAERLDRNGEWIIRELSEFVQLKVKGEQ